MRRLGSMKYLFILLLVVFLMSGCGGSDDSGGSSSSPSSNSTPNTNTPTKPTPNPETNSHVGTYIDTYDIADVLDGQWNGVSGSGTATGSGGQYGLLLSSMAMTVVRTQIAGNTGTTYITYRQYWNTEDKDWYYRTLLYGDAELMKMYHVGSDMWRLEGSDGTVATVTLTSETTAIVTQDGIANIEGYPYDYSVRYTIRKR